VELVEADERVDLARQFPLKLLAVALHHATGHDHALHAARLLERGGVQDRPYRFFPRRFDEAARVHDEHVRFGRLLDERASRGVEMPEHHLGVDEVLRAPEADDADLDRGHG
jgi:hypothetical protein